MDPTIPVEELTSDEDVIALRIGRSIAASTDQLSEAISFKAGCVVVASIFGDVLESTSLVMSVFSEVPAITLHVDWSGKGSARIADSRESGFEESVPDVCAENASWKKDYPGRMHIELRSRDVDAGSVGGLDAVSALLLPFLELSRRTDRLNRAMALLELAMSPVLDRSSGSVSSQIVQRLGQQVDSPAAFYPASSIDLEDSVEPQHIYPGRLTDRVSEHLFGSFGRIPAGPVQRALLSPSGAAPTTRSSIGSGDDAVRINSMLSRLDVIDYMALRVVHNDRPIGVIVCVLTDPEGQEQPRTFTGNDIATTASSAFIAGWAIPLAEQQAGLRRTLYESEMLRHLVLVSIQHKDRDETLSMATGVARIIYGADYVAIGSVNRFGEMTDFRHVTGNRTEIHKVTPAYSDSELIHEWLQNPRLVVLPNLSNRPDMTPDSFPILHGEGLVTSIISPFEVSGGTWIVLLIGFRSLQEITEQDTRFAHALSQTIAAVI